MAKTMVDIVVFCGFFITFAVKLLIPLVNSEQVLTCEPTVTGRREK